MANAGTEMGLHYSHKKATAPNTEQNKALTSNPLFPKTNQAKNSPSEVKANNVLYLLGLLDE
jgi:hypothetical protein